MDVRVAIPDEFVSPETLEPALEATTLVNEQLIRAGRTPLASTAINSGVRWQPEPPGDESFDHSELVWSRGWGDCDDLAPWRAAELRVTGEDPGANAIIIPSGPNTWHAVVERSDGTIDDPSLAAGMPLPGQGYALPIERTMVVGKIYVGVQPDAGGGWQARIDVPVVGCAACGCSLCVIEADETPRQAVARAADRAAVVGQFGGAATTDVAKLQALAAVADGISQRQLISHVDPDLLLCAVLLDQTIARKLDQWHRDRGMVVGRFSEVLPHNWFVAGISQEALDLGRRFQQGASSWWDSPEGQAAKAARKLGKQFQQGMSRWWASPQGRREIARRKAATKMAKQFQKGMARWWASPQGKQLRNLIEKWPDQATLQAVKKRAVEHTRTLQAQDAGDKNLPEGSDWPPELAQVVNAASEAWELANTYEKTLREHGFTGDPSGKLAALRDAAERAQNASADIYSDWYHRTWKQTGYWTNADTKSAAGTAAAIAALIAAIIGIAA
jgi:hypothetical protein